MTFRSLSLFSFLFILATATAQLDHYEYLGVIKLNDSAFISYKLAFEELDGQVQGHSLTDVGGRHETRSNIRGTYDEDSNLFKFEEYDIVYTKSPLGEVDMCLVNFQGKMRDLEKSKAFSGDFTGLYPDRTACMNGMIIMSSTQKAEEQAAKIDRKIQRSRKVSEDLKEKFSAKRILDTLSYSIVKNNENLNVFTKTKNVIVSIYDSGKVDDDRINLYVDGKLILEDYSIVRAKKEIPITITKRSTEIKVEALSEGSSAPNTVKVEILDGSNFITTRTSLKTGESAKLTLVKD